MGDSSGYTYKPLGGLGVIRLFTILQCDDSDEIKWQLHPRHLGERPVYKALSYVWGNAKLCERILLDGMHFASLHESFC